MKAIYLIAGSCICIFLLGFYLARDEPDGQKGKVMGPFYKLGMYLYGLFSERGRAKGNMAESIGSGRRSVLQALKQLHPGEAPPKLQAEYYAGKLALSLAVCFVGAVLGFLISIKAQIESQPENGSIPRGDFTKEAEEVELEGVFADGVHRFSMEVGTRTLSEKELNEYFEQLCSILPERILGENTDMKEVHANLLLAEQWEDFPFELYWDSSDRTLLSAEGIVSEVEYAQDCTLTVRASCGDFERTETFGIRVIPPRLTPEEQQYRAREQQLRESEAQSRESDRWILPKELGTQSVSWRLVVEDHGLQFLVIAMVVAFLIYFLADKDLQDKLADRRQALRRDYPEIVHKLVLYMGAGMTIRGSLDKLSRSDPKRPIYEELRYACRELQTGVSEQEVYDRLGKRLGVKEYIRLTTLLSQNLKRGNSTLLQRLTDEAARAADEHLQYARKKGEEASTKLLLPMVLMLLVIMVILILPAFWAIGV